MIAQYHRRNHNFTILNNLVGSCHTADAAYILLLELREDRQAAVDAHAVQALRDAAKELRAQVLIAGDDPAAQLDGKAELLEVANNRRAGAILLAAAQDEIAFIDKLIVEADRKRELRHRSIEETAEEMCEEEWRLELLARAENFLLTTGSIPPDQLEAMRQHPRFGDSIMPRIAEIQTLLAAPDGPAILRAQVTQSIPLLQGKL